MQEFPHRRFSFAQLLALPAHIWQICGPHTLVFFNKIHKLFAETSELQHRLLVTSNRIDELLQKHEDLSEHINILNKQIRSLSDNQRRNGTVSPQPDTLTTSHVLSFPVNRPIIDTTRPFRGEINLSANDGILSRYETLYSSYHCDKQQSHNPNYKQYIIQTFVYPLFEKPSSEDAVLVNFYNNDMCIVVADGVSQSAFGGIAAEYVCKYIHFEWIMALQYDEFIPTHTQLHNKTEQLIREALYQAMYHVNKSVVQAIQKSSGYKQPVLNELFDTVGSQATFACVFTHANNLICVWMGNTRIILMKSATRSIIAADDIRFDSDQERFSSHPSTLNHSGGMFGNPQIQIIPLHDIESLHVIIMSDGFENNKNGMIESLFAQQPNQSTIHATNASFSDDSSLVYVKLPTKRDHT